MSTTNSKVQARIKIRKPENAKRSFRGLTLINDMTVLLISDPTVTKAAVAVDVNIGYFSDPDDLPGLAHLCQRTLTCGTKKDPVYNFKHYVWTHNGSINNSTSAQHATYYFDISVENFECALQQYVRFFLAPIFEEKCIEESINIINEEYEANMKDDFYRLKEFVKLVSKADHPYSKFGYGNKETLSAIPRIKGINIRRRLLDFFEKYYSANIMSLCVISNETLDDIEKMVIPLFCKIPNKMVDVLYYGQPCKNQCGTKWYIVPIEDIKILRITLPLPETRFKLWNSFIYFICYLLRYKENASFLSIIKNLGWCEKMTTKIDSYARRIDLFHLTIILTKDGLSHINDIIGLFFQCIDILSKDINLKELNKRQIEINSLYKKFARKAVLKSKNEGSYDDINIKNIVQALQVTSINNILYLKYRDNTLTFNQNMIDTILSYIVPRNIRVYVIAKKCQSIACETLKWYDIKYKEKKISKENFATWKKPYSGTKFLITNEFLEKLNVNAKYPIHRIKKTVKFPKLLAKSTFATLWYKWEITEEKPVIMYLYFLSPYVCKDPVNTNLNTIFVTLIKENLKQVFFKSAWQSDLIASPDGILVKIFGYDKELFLAIVEQIMHLNIDTKKFKTIKKNYIDKLKAFAMLKPTEQAKFYQALLLSQKYYTTEDLLEATACITIDQVKKYQHQFIRKMYTVSFINGSVTKNEVHSLYSTLMSVLSHNISNSITKKELQWCREIKLRDGCHFVFEVKHNVYNCSCVHVYYQFGIQSVEANALAKLLCHIVMSLLKLEEQLNSASCYMHKSDIVLGLNVVVKSPNDPLYIEERLETFMNSMFIKISKMHDDEFDAHKEHVSHSFLQEKVFRKEEDIIAEYWNEILTQQYNFNRLNKENAYLKAITQRQLVNFCKRVLHKRTPKLSVHVIYKSEPLKANTTISNGKTNTITCNGKSNSTSTDVKLTKENIFITEYKEFKKIDNIESFKRSQTLYIKLEPKKFSKKVDDFLESSPLSNTSVCTFNSSDISNNDDTVYYL